MVAVLSQLEEEEKKQVMAPKDGPGPKPFFAAYSSKYLGEKKKKKKLINVKELTN